MIFNTCKTCGANNGRAGNLINDECLNCYDTRKDGKATLHDSLNRTAEEIEKTFSILEQKQPNNSNMHTPTKSQWQTVIDNFEKVLPLATLPDHLNMMETEVNEFGKCGTVHCVGGWYAVSTLDTSGGRLSFKDGSLKMANDLGFAEISDLEYWAGKHSEIWGNEMGFYMFSGVSAYDFAETLSEAVEFLKGVRDRSPE